MNNQLDLLTIIPESAAENYDLTLLYETADSIYWTIELPYKFNMFSYNTYIYYNNLIKENVN